MDVRRALKAVSERWLLVLVTALTFACLGLGGTALVPERYTATARGFVSVGSPESRSPNVMTSGSLYIVARMPSYAALGRSGQVLDAVRDELDLEESTTDLRSTVESEAIVDTAFIEVTATRESPAEARLVADATVNEVATSVRELENGSVVMAISDPASASESPANRGYLINSSLALLAGIVVGAGAALELGHRQARRRSGPA